MATQLSNLIHATILSFFCKKYSVGVTQKFLNIAIVEREKMFDQQNSVCVLFQITMKQMMT